MFLPVSSEEGHDGIPARLSAMSSSNFRLTLVVSLVAGVNCERTRMPSLMFSYAAPTGGATPSTLSDAQESLPGVFGKAQVGTTGGAAAALAREGR